MGSSKHFLRYILVTVNGIQLYIQSTLRNMFFFIEIILELIDDLTSFIHAIA